MTPSYLSAWCAKTEVNLIAFAESDIQASEVVMFLFRQPRVRIRVENLIILRLSALTQVFHATKKAPRKPLKFIKKHSDNVLQLFRSDDSLWEAKVEVCYFYGSTPNSLLYFQKGGDALCLVLGAWCTSSKAFALRSVVLTITERPTEIWTEVPNNWFSTKISTTLENSLPLWTSYHVRKFVI